MITIFNRKEVFITFDDNEQANIRAALAAEGIDYSFRLLTGNNAFQSAVNARHREGYKFYVRKKDYKKAAYTIRKYKERA